MQEKKYGLIIRAPKSNNKTQLTRPNFPKPVGFLDDDDDDVEQEISRQATKNKSLKEVEEQHRKALEEDPSVFDYDGVYDDMKSELVKPKVQERQQRESKYIHVLKQNAKQREREHEVVYERKLAKERSQDEHLFADKDKFLTGAYKRKLAEKEQWEREEKLRQLREERDDVTKKSDLSDFYFNIQKNVAFGGADKKPEKQVVKEPASTSDEVKKPVANDHKPVSSTLQNDHPTSSPNIASSSRSEDRGQEDFSAAPQKILDTANRPDTSGEEKPPSEVQPPNDQPKQDHHKKNEDALAAAKERFLARKKAKVVEY